MKMFPSMLIFITMYLMLQVVPMGLNKRSTHEFQLSDPCHYIVEIVVNDILYWR